ncbi:MAG: signal peptidase II [Phenylobacterium sp.]
MKGVTRAGWTAFVLAAAVIAADQASKYWILSVLKLAEGQSIPVAGPLHLTGVWNHGVSFGLLTANHDLARWAFVAFSLIVAVILAGWVRRTERPLFATALGFLIGGAVGNAVDRVRFGAVADFIDVSRLHFPWVFNVADAAINVGIACLLLDMLLQDRQEKASKVAGDAA